MINRRQFLTEAGSVLVPWLPRNFTDRSRDRGDLLVAFAATVVA